MELSAFVQSDQAGYLAAIPGLIFDLLRAHLLADGRSKGDVTTKPALACGKNKIDGACPSWRRTITCSPAAQARIRLFQLSGDKSASQTALHYPQRGSDDNPFAQVGAEP
jgi:hypothetical protein